MSQFHWILFVHPRLKECRLKNNVHCSYRLLNYLFTFILHGMIGLFNINFKKYCIVTVVTFSLRLVAQRASMNTQNN